MNKYLHNSGFEISMQDSFALMNHAQGNTAKSIGRLLTERPGVKEESFVVETEKVRSPGGTVQQYLVVTCGDAFFSNSEVFIASPYEVSIPIEQAPGYRYLVLKYRSMRQTKGKFSERFKADNEYLFVDDYVSLFIRNKAILALDGSEMILARFLYTAVMSEPQIEMNRPRYSNAWSIAEAMPSNKPDIEIVQLLHDMLRKSSHETLLFVPKSPMFLQALSKMQMPTPPFRAFKIIKAGMNNGQAHSLSQMLPMREIGSDHYDGIRMFPGIAYSVTARNVDLYRGTLGTWSEPEEVVGGFPVTGTPSLNLASGIFEGMDAIWVRPYFDYAADMGGVFVQLWASTDEDYPAGEPHYEIPMRSYPSSTVSVPIRQLIPIPVGAEEIHITARLIDAQNNVLKSKTQLVTLTPPSAVSMGNHTFTMTFGRDAFSADNLTCRFCNNAGTQATLFKYKNVSGKTEHIVRALLTNYAADAGFSNSGQVVSVSPHVGIVLDVDCPAAPPPPYESSWIPGDVSEYIEVPHGATVVFRTSFALSTHCDFFGTIQLMIVRDE